jgi:hypothetical protein
MLTREVAHDSALRRWGLRGGRPEGLGRFTVLVRRSLQWRRGVSVAGGGG